MRKTFVILSALFLSFSIISCDFFGTTNSSSSTSGLFTVTFDTNGGNEIDSIQASFGNSINLPTPIKAGYSFSGWFTGDGTNDTQFTVISTVSNHLTLYARWQINQFTIAFETNGGSPLSNITQDFGTAFSIPSTSKDNYQFAGWYLNSELTQPFTMATISAQNITIYAKWNPNQHTISFDENGGQAISDITQPHGTIVVEPQEPTKEGYTFEGWYDNPEFSGDPILMIQSGSFVDINLFAKWVSN